MQSKISRRDFIKLASTLAVAPFVPITKPTLALKEIRTGEGNSPNIIILLFDALSAFNMGIYGYGRDTTPNLDQFAGKATVYHSHYAASSYTTPSTASIFTGVYPWTHRVFQIFGPIEKHVQPNNLWSKLGENRDYYRLAYSQNLLADSVLHQFSESLDQHLDSGAFGEINQTFHHKLLPKDGYFGLRGVDEVMFRSTNDKQAASLVLSMINNIVVYLREKSYLQKHKGQYPLGLGRSFKKIFFTVEETMSGVGDLLYQLANPTLAYIHFYFPHNPYVPNKEFMDKFKDDGWKPVAKKVHPLSQKADQEKIDTSRRLYDEYIATFDAEFGRVMAQLEAKGLMENSYIIVTSDHGEMFERGAIGHSKPLLYEPQIRVPLIISKPGQHEREDVFALTNTVDLPGSILQACRQPVPDQWDGKLLPGMGGVPDDERSVFSMHVPRNSAFEPLNYATIAMVKGDYKLMSFLGYADYENQYELYDLKNDPEELDDLYSEGGALAREMKAELENKLADVNRPYQE